ncbi:hypothetical protein N7490_006390 [Penicillium lividum]|nr:hypothetical protein N7490_006390 [Penicillium lividum]
MEKTPPVTWAVGPHHLPPATLSGMKVPTHAVLREQFHYVFMNRDMLAELLDPRPRNSVSNWLLLLQGRTIQSAA